MKGRMGGSEKQKTEAQRSSEARWFTMNNVPLAGEAKLTGLPLLLKWFLIPSHAVSASAGFLVV